MSSSLHLSAELVAVVAGLLTPAVTAALVRTHAPPRVKVVVNAGVAALAGAGATAVTTASGSNWQSYFLGAATAWITSVAAYFGWQKPVGITDSISDRTANFGMGGAPTGAAESQSIPADSPAAPDGSGATAPVQPLQQPPDLTPPPSNLPPPKLPKPKPPPRNSGPAA